MSNLVVVLKLLVHAVVPSEVVHRELQEFLLVKSLEI
jgi:hypothetical protein